MAKINYPALRPMDLVLCAGKSPFAGITRVVTGGGWRSLFKRDIAVHVGMVIELHGQFLIAEMQAKGLELNSLERYSKAGKRRWVIEIKRSSIYDNADTRQRAQERVANDLRHTLDYDYKGLLTFVFKRVEDDKARAYCSEYYYQISKPDGVPYSPAFERRVSPHDLQKSGAFYTVDNWRLP